MKNRRMKQWGALLVAVWLLLCGSGAFAAQRGDVYAVTASRVNFRSGAGVKFSVVGILTRGESVTFISDHSGWWYVRNSDGEYGYVDHEYLSPKGSASSGTYTTTSNLRVRKSASTSSGTLGVLKSGTSVYIARFDGDWGYVSSGTLNGWVSLKYLKAGGSVTTTTTSGTTYRVTASKLNMRSSAATSGNIVKTMSKGDSFVVTKTSGNWAYGSSGSDYGWAWLGYLSAGSTVGTGSYQVTASALNVRESASGSADRVDSLSRGDLVRVYQTSGSWAYISYVKGNTIKNGWVSTQYLTAA